MRDAITAFGGGLIVVTALSIGILTLVEQMRPPASPEPPARVAELMTCPAGGTVQASYRQEANAFLVVGRLGAVDDETLRVEAPVGEIDIDLSLDASIAGDLDVGDPVVVGGRVAKDGRFEATQVRSGCQATFVAEPEPSPTAAPDDGAAVANVTPAPTPIPAPPAEPQPAAAPGDDAPDIPPTTAPTPAPTIRAPAALPSVPPPVNPTPAPTPPPVATPRPSARPADEFPGDEKPDGPFGVVLD